MGNPIEYLGNALSWDNIRRLMSYVNDDYTISYTYNDEGIRTSKIVNGVKHEYVLEGSTILFEKYNDVFIIYFYDEVGLPIGMAYRKASEANLELDMENQFEFYLFTKNLQGDILNIYSEDGTKVASYNYDAWGNHTVTNYTSDNIGDINPFRYRGYYFDSETNFYYLNSRYYDPEIKRFISADNISIVLATPNGLTDKNLYAYCDNNPIMRRDDGGEFWHVLGGALIGFAGQLVSDLVTSAIEGELSFSHWSCYVGATIGGAVGALIPIPVVSDLVSSSTATVISAVSYNIESAIAGRDEYYSSSEIFCTTVLNALSSAMIGGIFRNTKIYSKLPTKQIDKLDIGLRDFAGSVVSSSMDAMKNYFSEEWPDTTTWETPNVERRYPFR